MAMGRGGSSKLTRNKRTETQKKNIAAQKAKTEQNRMRKMMYNARMNPKDRQLLESIARRYNKKSI